MRGPAGDVAVRRWPPLRGVDAALLLSTTLAVHVLGVGAVLLAPGGSPVASWWPGAGLGTGLAAVLPARRRPVVLAAVLLGTLTGNLAGGRPPAVAVLFALANALEVAIAAHLLTGGQPARLAEVVDLRRLVTAVVAAAGVAGLVIGSTVAVLLDGSLLQTVVAVVPSHTAAQLLVVPVVLALRSRTPGRRPVETVVQGLVLATVTALVFAVGDLPLTFAPLTVLVWGAVRLGLRTVTVELLLVVVGVTLLTASGLGPFAAVGLAPSTTTLVLQLFAVSSVVVVLPLTLAVRQREQATARLAASEALFRGGFTQSLLGMLMLERRGGALRVVRSNPVADAMLGAPGTSLLGADVTACLGPTEGDGLTAAVDDLLEGRSTGWRHEVAGKGSPVRWFDMALSVVPAGRGAPGEGVVSVQLVDVTARRDAEAQLARLALHDPLTGLANRVLLADRLTQVLASARRSGCGPALLFLDLDDFKRVNDEDGHATGDEVLRVVAARLSAVARAADTVARLGGDEFVVLCPDTPDPATARALAERVVAVASLPIPVGGREVAVRASVGVVLGAIGCSADGLLRDADTAMYAAKAQGKGRAVVFRADLHPQPA